MAQLLARVCRAAGAPDDQVFYKAPKDDPHKRAAMSVGCTLPGFYRPTKDWDLVVYAGHEPIVVVELKSQNGPSYGNNANNRAEEAIGNAVDLHRARRAGLIPGDPWTGYAYVIEDDQFSRLDRGKQDAGFLPKDPEFPTWTYVGRVASLSHRLVQEGLYRGAWPVATSRPSCPDIGRVPAEPKCAQRKSGNSTCVHSFDWTELDPTRYGYSRFVEGMTAKIAEHYPNARPGGDTAITLFD